MIKHYHAILIPLIGAMVVSLSVSLSPHRPQSAEGIIVITTSQVFAEESHSYGSDGYDEEGYDHDGHDRDGYDREGYSDDGHHRDGHHDEAHDHHGRHTYDNQGAAQTYEAKPTVKQY